MEDTYTQQSLPREAKDIMGIPLYVRSKPNKLTWHCDPRGNFTVKSAYRLAVLLEERYGVQSNGRGRGPVMVKTVAGTVVIVISSSVYSMVRIKSRSEEISGALTPTAPPIRCSSAGTCSRPLSWIGRHASEAKGMIDTLPLLRQRFERRARGMKELKFQFLLTLRMMRNKVKKEKKRA
ncbi:uncharacterized protein A4U43_C07F20290 [Asparagus officinalis]|uniref:Uncharacterized protein n=1 Tax=Asparagus officinalis TaxID=4686 RepID=A0A5P1EGU6_ASPOF|nr:uncharacterized protein A4U43_C07F20290 [Asparagus officinalis]